MISHSFDSLTIEQITISKCEIFFGRSRRELKKCNNVGYCGKNSFVFKLFRYIYILRSIQ